MVNDSQKPTAATGGETRFVIGQLRKEKSYESSQTEPEQTNRESHMTFREDLMH